MTFQRFQTDSYELSISFDLNSYNSTVFEAVSLSVQTANPQFNIFSISTRVILFIMAIIGLASFCIRFKNLRNDKLVFEYRLIIFLSVALLFFDDPIFAASTVAPSVALDCVSTIFVMIFYNQLILSWVLIWWKAKVGNQENIPGHVLVLSIIASFLMSGILATQSLVNNLYVYFEPAINSTDMFF